MLLDAGAPFRFESLSPPFGAAKVAIRAVYEIQDQSIDSAPIELRLGVNEGKQACLMFDGREISTAIGAELILDRILFPDLPRSNPLIPACHATIKIPGFPA